MTRQLVLRLHTDIIVDNFAGGGGASLGIEWALGRSPDIAVNHDPEAIAMHAENHPDTHHVCGDVWDVDPQGVCQGRRVSLAWFSPDCKHFSKAKGGKPVEKKIRGLAWVVVRWARAVKPRVIILENVEEFADWGPLLADGRPCPVRRGLTFRRWLGQLHASGYQTEMRQLRACDYGAPTSRKRLFVIARCDGQPIVWPSATHGPTLDRPHRTAAECITWEVPCPSIFERERPLAENTLKRIARGVQRYVIDAPTPFLVPRGRRLVAPSLVQTGYGERKGQAPRALDIRKPLGTIIAGGTGGNGKHALVAAFLSKHYGDPERKTGGGVVIGKPLPQPIGTITARDHHALVTAFLVKYYGTGEGAALAAPLGTVTSRDRFGLVHVSGEPYAIADIGLRMLDPRELFRAQGFPEHFRIAIQLGGKELSKKAQVRMCGNSVPPPIAEALVRANVAVATKACA